MKLLKLVLAGSFLMAAGTFSLVLPEGASAHEGKLDSMGCHYGRNHRDYHCHEGRLEGQTFHSRAEAIRHYNRTWKNRDKDDDDGGGL